MFERRDFAPTSMLGWTKTFKNSSKMGDCEPILPVFACN
jgi:hypothetical protein